MTSRGLEGTHTKQGPNPSTATGFNRPNLNQQNTRHHQELTCQGRTGSRRVEGP